MQGKRGRMASGHCGRGGDRSSCSSSCSCRCSLRCRQSSSTWATGTCTRRTSRPRSMRAAFAGGDSWGFPCGPDVDARIEQQARMYVGDHTAANGTVVTGSYNPQVEGVGANQIFVTLNQSQWWSGGFSGSDFSSPSSAVCDSKILDVKATEHDTPSILGLIPLFPDIKRKARVEIQEIAGLTGLLPIAVRSPQPPSAAAVFYNESNGSILDVKYFRYVCNPSFVLLKRRAGRHGTYHRARGERPVAIVGDVERRSEHGCRSRRASGPRAARVRPPRRHRASRILAGSAGLSTTSVDKPVVPRSAMRRDRYRDRSDGRVRRRLHPRLRNSSSNHRAA